MARTHEELRLGEPSNRTTQVRAVDREDLELVSLQAPDPAGDVARSLRPTGW